MAGQVRMTGMTGTASVVAPGGRRWMAPGGRLAARMTAPRGHHGAARMARITVAPPTTITGAARPPSPLHP